MLLNAAGLAPVRRAITLLGVYRYLAPHPSALSLTDVLPTRNRNRNPNPNPNPNRNPNPNPSNPLSR